MGSNPRPQGDAGQRPDAGQPLANAARAAYNDPAARFQGQATEAAPQPQAYAGPRATASWESLPPPPPRTTAGKRRAPGQRKKTSKTRRTTVPAIAGMATLVVTSASAVALNNTAGGPPNASTNLNRAMPATLPIGGNTADLEQRERSQQRPDRSERKQATAGQASTGKTSDLAQDRTFAQQRAAWEAKQAERIAAAEQKAQGDNSGTAVVPRVIEWVAPIESYSLSAGFGESSSLWSTTHTGQDFSADLGTPVQSVGDGTVEYVGWDGAYGKQVRILHEDGTETWYSHLSDYGVSTGETVNTGETIGYVGSTGNSTGPHLHFEVRPYGGDPIDPMPWLRERGLPM